MNHKGLSQGNTGAGDQLQVIFVPVDQLVTELVFGRRALQFKPRRPWAGKLMYHSALTVFLSRSGAEVT